MERLARPKDDLFDNSTMTFGEHLEELRGSLVKAIIWLLVGLGVGLYFAADVVRYVQNPLSDAIHDFNADRALVELGYEDPKAEELQPLRDFLRHNSLIWEIIYEIPDEHQSELQIALTAAEDSAEADGTEETESDSETDAASEADTVEADTVDTAQSGTIDTISLANLLTSIPDPSALTPKVQLKRSKASASTLKVEESFMIWIKAGLIVGAVVGSPMIFYHLWSFVAAGLHNHERKYVYIYLPVSVVLFVSGVSLAFFLVLHYVLEFLLQFNGTMEVSVEPRLTYYINFVLMLPLGFGVAFQLPLVMLFLQRIGLIETENYISSWRIAVLVIFIISMVVTPADVTSMVALALPLLVLYFLGIMMCKFIPRGRGLGSAAYDPA